MRFIHLSDLHLGKRLNEFSLLEDQEYILARILSIIDAERPDAVLLAGDVYDRPVPPAEAVGLFDDFLVRLAKRDLQVFVISGNHDSPERIAFGARLMDKSGVHLSPVYDGAVAPVTLEDAWGPVRVYMLPFLKPAHVRRFCPDETIETYTDAMAAAVARMKVDTSVRNVLITHQFVAGASPTESEEISAVGGAASVDPAVFEPFDYVALGHLHGPQRVGRDTIRYCGAPLKYSFSEKDQQKSVTIADLMEKGRVELRTVPLTPRRELRELRGTYNELTARSFYEGTATDDYLHILLTDEDDVPDAVARLRTVYPNLMKLDYDNARTRSGGGPIAPAAEHRSPPELLADFYEAQNGQPLSDNQLRYVRQLFADLQEERL